MSADLSQLKQNIRALLQDLTALHAVSGHEQPVVRYLADRLRPLADEVEVDRFGNVTATRRGPEGAPCMALVAHSDEVGAVVHSITTGGLLRMEPVGVVSPRIFPAARVAIKGLLGVVGTPAGHVEGDDRVRPIAELAVDIGAGSEAAVRAMGIGEGDPITFVADLASLGGGGDLVTGKALDNRVGCAILLALLELLKDQELSVTLRCVITVQEEIGMQGAAMVAQRLQPEMAIALDTVPADDTRVSGGAMPRFRLGGGPVVQLREGVMRSYVGTVHHPGVLKAIKAAALREGIPLQVSVSGRWTTDAAAFHTAAGGIPTGFISIPRRYAHSPAEVLDLNDPAQAVRLLVSLARDPGTGRDLSFI